ncbi:MAG: hypothetical protein CMH27_01070 [Micavibrio sp.]|nr:hypothetical protein [Micavibrio sp.]
MTLTRMRGITATAASAFAAMSIMASSPAYAEDNSPQIETDTPSVAQEDALPPVAGLEDPMNAEAPIDAPTTQVEKIHYTLDDIRQFVWNPDEEWTIDIDGGITARTGEQAIKKLFEMANENPDHDIVMRINSPGGDAWATLKMWDAMHVIPNNVHTLCTGMAASGGSYLCMGNSSGQTVVTPGLMSMTHNSRMTIPPQRGPIQLTDGTLEAGRIQTEILKNFMCGSTDALADNPRRCDVIGSLFSSADFWATPEELKAIGLVDHILYPENFNHNGQKSGKDLLCDREEPRAISLCNALYAQQQIDDKRAADALAAQAETADVSGSPEAAKENDLIDTTAGHSDASVAMAPSI